MTAQRPSMSTTTPLTMSVNISSPRRGGMSSILPHRLLASAQTIVPAQSTQMQLPTQFARSEESTSPRTNSAKLVVIPHDGHGFPVIVTKLYAGMPSCVCDDIVIGF